MINEKSIKNLKPCEKGHTNNPKGAPPGKRRSSLVQRIDRILGKKRREELFQEVPKKDILNAFHLMENITSDDLQLLLKNGKGKLPMFVYGRLVAIGGDLQCRSTAQLDKIGEIIRGKPTQKIQMDANVSGNVSFESFLKMMSPPSEENNEDSSLGDEY